MFQQGAAWRGSDSGTTVKSPEERAARFERAKARAKANRKAREEVMKSLGLTKVRGNLGGTYWE